MVHLWYWRIVVAGVSGTLSLLTLRCNTLQCCYRDTTVVRVIGPLGAQEMAECLDVGSMLMTSGDQVSLRHYQRTI